MDGEVVTRQGVQVDPRRSVVEVDGRRVAPHPFRWVMLHKPPGCLCTRGDREGRPTVYELLDEADARLFHVGRLDYMSEGLLLLTNDGDTAAALLHPSSQVPRRYEVVVARPVPDDLEERLLRGVQLADGPARVESVARRRAGRRDEVLLELTLREGRNREVRRVMDELGVEIHSLKRVAFGPLDIRDLARGSWRPLEASEIAALESLNRNG